MGTTLNQAIRGLSPERRAKIEARAAQLIAQEMTLRDVRKARNLTQERMAELLKIGQDGVSRLEKRSDLLLSTLQNFIKALGGRLRLIAEFPDRPPVVLAALSGAPGESEAGNSQKTNKSKTARPGL